MSIAAITGLRVKKVDHFGRVVRIEDIYTSHSFPFIKTLHFYITFVTNDMFGFYLSCGSSPPHRHR